MKNILSVGKRHTAQIVGGLFAAVSTLAVTSVFAADAKFENYTQAIPGTTAKFDMVAIPGGEITIGSPENEAGRDDKDLAQKKVTVKPFWMGKYEVSWAEFLPYVFGDRDEIEKEKKDGITRPTKPYGSVYRDRGEKGYPALGMSQHSAENFCKWLSYKTGEKYRLPTEAEWEYACRAGATTPYFWGDDASKAGDYAWFKDNSEITTQPIGKKQPNKFGLYDIVGNVTEWVQKESAEAPAVARGGAFDQELKNLRSASRMFDCPEWNELDPQSPPSIWWLSAADFVGIRLVRSADEGNAAPAAAAPAAAATATAGGDDKTLANYKKYCAGCHGADGKGQTKLGAKMGSRNYTDAKVKETLKDDAMFKAIKEGLKKDGKDVMHPFAEKLTDDEITALVKHMKAFK